MGKGCEILKDNSSWSLENGEIINLREDSWLGVGPIHGCLFGPLKENEGSLKVREIIVDENWNLDNLSVDLPPHIKDQIRSIPLPLPIDIDD